LLVIIPTVTAVAAGGVFIASSVRSALVNQRVVALANLSGTITGLVQALQNEREDTVRFIVLGSGDGGRGASPASAIPPDLELGLLKQDYAVSNGWASQVRALAGAIGGAYPALAQQDTQAAVTAIGDLPAIRAAATGTQLPAPIVINEYSTALSALLAVESQIAVGSGDSTLAGSVRVLGLVSSMKEEATWTSSTRRPRRPSASCSTRPCRARTSCKPKRRSSRRSRWPRVSRPSPPTPRSPTPAPRSHTWSAACGRRSSSSRTR